MLIHKKISRTLYKLHIYERRKWFYIQNIKNIHEILELLNSSCKCDSNVCLGFST